jgi:replicative DNA helicase
MTQITTLQTISTHEAEKAVIAGLLKGHIQAHATGLTPFDFEDEWNRNLFAGCLELTQDGSDVDLMILTNHLQSVMDEFDAPSLASLSSFAAKQTIPANFNPSIGFLKSTSAKRQLARIGEQLKDLAALENTESPKEILSYVENQLDEIRRHLGDKVTNRRHVSEIAVEALERYQTLYEGKQINIPTGIADIDRVTRGGGSPGDVWIVGAFTGQGKSALALQIARNQAAMGIPSLTISREMLDIENFERLHSASSGIPLWMVKPYMTDRVYDGLRESIKDVVQKPMWIDSESSNIFDMRREIKDAVKNDGVRVVFVDYLQLVQGSEKGRGMDRTAEITFVSKMLKQTAMENKVWIIALAQYNRLANYAGKAENHSFDGSSQIEKDASIVLHLELEKIEDGRQIPKWRKATLRMGKGRNAPTLSCELWFRGEVFTFADTEG